MMRVLIAYGTRIGGTIEIAEIVGDVLTDAGFRVEVRAASDAADVGAYDAVVIGGPLAAGRRHRHAGWLLKRNPAARRGRPVWLFSSWPLDGSAANQEIPPVEQVRQRPEWVGARGQVTFGGRLPSDAEGIPASAMAETRGGDWHDPERVHAWAREVARQLRAPIGWR
jgi:menaquinone-dependent protoporphyrinogen oxidase